MSSIKCSVINRIWIGSMRRSYNKFQRSLLRIETIQESYLLRLLMLNSNTEFGKRHNFSSINSIKRFQDQVPLSTYDDYGQYIDAIAEGNSNVLTSDRVRVFEPSSGSTSASKLIPYTKSLKQEFNQGIAPWMFSLYKENPGLLRGKAYWSISPSMCKESKRGEINIGFEDDSEYLGFLGRYLYNEIAAVPSSVGKETDIDAFRNHTLAYLLLCENLALISIWNPTFMTLLLEHLLCHQNEVLEAMRKLRSGRNLRRANEVEKLLLQRSSETVFQEIWPDLAVISCWTDGACGSYAKQLQSFFPDVKIQGKGLITTEAFVSLPLPGSHDPVLAVNSHFFEFIDEETGQIRLAHELATGKTYSVVVSTGGGLYRYQLEDIIEVTGLIGSAPTFRFISKSNHISDLAGEKLNERHVNDCFENMFQKYNLQPDFFLLAPIENGNSSIRYCVFLQDNSLIHERTAKFLADFENMLCKNFHYDYCRKLGQINKLALFSINSHGSEVYHKEMLRRKIGCGDIKPICLDKYCSWDKLFFGTLLK